MFDLHKICFELIQRPITIDLISQPCMYVWSLIYLPRADPLDGQGLLAGSAEVPQVVLHRPDKRVACRTPVPPAATPVAVHKHLRKHAQNAKQAAVSQKERGKWAAGAGRQARDAGRSMRRVSMSKKWRGHDALC